MRSLPFRLHAFAYSSPPMVFAPPSPRMLVFHYRVLSVTVAFFHLDQYVVTRLPLQRESPQLTPFASYHNIRPFLLAYQPDSSFDPFGPKLPLEATGPSNGLVTFSSDGYECPPLPFYPFPFLRDRRKRPMPAVPSFCSLSVPLVCNGPFPLTAPTRAFERSPPPYSVPTA